MAKIPVPPRRQQSIYAPKIDYSEPAAKQRETTWAKRKAIDAKVRAEWAEADGATMEEPNKTFVGVRLPPDPVARVDAHAKREGTNRSEAIRRLIEAGLS